MGRRAHGDVPRITPKKAKNAIAVVRVVAPAVLPVVAPVAVRAVAVVRERYDQHRARKLGVPVDDLAKFSGKGAALQARIAGAGKAIGELRDRARQGDGFLSDAETILWQLAAAVRVAERLPASRRRAAHRAASRELDQIEQQLLHRLGLGATRRRR